jgi:ubiquinol-cytochrome c reductase iron-sulfur subunit
VSVVRAALAWVARLIVAAVALLLGRRRVTAERDSRELPATPRKEFAVAALFIAAALVAVASIVVYATGADTQLMGITAGVCFGLLGAALILASRAVVPQIEETEERPPWSWPQADREEAGLEDSDRVEAARTSREIARAGEGITRRRLLFGAGGAAGIAVGAATVVPLASLGPAVGDRLRKTAWRAGVPLVDDLGARVRADDLVLGSFITAFPLGADKDDPGSPVVVVHVDPSELRLPLDRQTWAPEGFVAYSKICTHAGCAVNLFRSPLYPPRAPSPALVCPCHYSTFDVLTGGDRIFGPAGRPLPQLPVRLDEDRRLVAAGTLSYAPGPSWSRVREGPS